MKSKLLKQTAIACAAIVAALGAISVPVYANATQDFWCGVVKDGTSGVFNTFNDCGAVLPTNKTNLHIIAQGSSKTTGISYESVFLEMNGDVGSNYDYWAGGATYNVAGIRVTDWPAASYRDGVADIWIPNYNSTALSKEVLSVQLNSLSIGLGMGLEGGIWHPVSTVAVQHVSLYLPGQSLFTSGSAFEVYTE